MIARSADPVRSTIGAARRGASIVASLVVLFSAVIATAAGARPHYRACGDIPQGADWFVAATRNVRCRYARHVIYGAIFKRDYDVDGFHCRDVHVPQPYVRTVCQRGRQYVRGTTSV